MTTIDDGGPAFPVPGNPATMPGMSLRDWFAGQAMASLVQHQHVTENLPPENADEVAQAKRYCFTNSSFFMGCGDLKELAEQAYRVADAMLAARKVTP